MREVIQYRKDNEWFDDECEKLVEKENKERKEYLERPTGTKKQIYENLRRNAKRPTQQEERQYLDETTTQVEEDLQKNNHKEAYETIYLLKKCYQPSFSLCFWGYHSRQNKNSLLLERILKYK